MPKVVKRELVHRMPSSSSMTLLAAPDVKGWWVRSSLNVRPLGADMTKSQTNPISDHTLYSHAHFAGVGRVYSLERPVPLQNPGLPATNPLSVASESVATGQGIACP